MMLETRAIVVHKNGNATLVEASGQDGCSVCDGKGCGSSKVGQLFCSKPRQFRVENRINAEVGDEVIVSVVEGAVLRGISMVYLLPLLLLFVGAVLAGSFAQQDIERDGFSAAGALAGLMLGFVIAKWHSARQVRNQPYIARLTGE